MAGFTGTDVFLPSVGAKPGVPPAVWFTTVWAHNPNATAANVTFYLLERKENLSPRTYTDTIPAGDTKRWDDAVKTMFGVETFGAIRVTSNVKLMVGSRIYSQSGMLEDSVGQFFAGVPASFAIGQGESTELTGVWQTKPDADSTFRYNFGFVEVTGIRQDAWANAHRIPVEEDKPADEQGTYLHPRYGGWGRRWVWSSASNNSSASERRRQATLCAKRRTNPSTSGGPGSLLAPASANG